MKKSVILPTVAGVVLGLSGCVADDNDPLEPHRTHTQTKSVSPTSSASSSRVTSSTSSTTTTTSSPTSRVSEKKSVPPVSSRVPQSTASQSPAQKVSRGQRRVPVPSYTAPRASQTSQRTQDTQKPVNKPQRSYASRSVGTSAPYAQKSGMWDKIAQCESGGNAKIVSPNGLYGGLYQIDRYGTWVAYGGKQYASTPEKATPDQQYRVAQKIQASQGWGAWPVCSRK